MTKSSVKRLSVLGLVLMAASAVTAAIIPSKNNSGEVRGQIALSSINGASHTCVPNAGDNCNVTVESGSTVAEGTISNTTTAD